MKKKDIENIAKATKLLKDLGNKEMPTKSFIGETMRGKKKLRPVSGDWSPPKNPISDGGSGTGKRGWLGEDDTRRVVDNKGIRYMWSAYYMAWIKERE